ncbi:MAG: T9SS type A sorting domain-containing protein [Crocinitomicaceae bacterium]|nr:T9SS type A sorting domain-containing protein [Flavobacteriales bacterium]NQZ37659.1 T9SS type A sorting domain-containing protein [Crocinitomicaceae bacterium]
MKYINVISTFILYVAFGLVSSKVEAQFLNSNFATNGYTQDILSYGEGKEILVQPDNKILVANQRRSYYSNTNTPDENYLYCNRYNVDGSLDASFGTNGIARFHHHNESEVMDIALQSNGKILIGGESKYCGNITCGWRNLVLGRLNTDGSTDLNFGNSGVIEAEYILGPMYLGSSINSIEVLNSGKIIISGISRISPDGTTNGVIRPFVARLTEDGLLDTSFGSTGTGLTFVDQFSIYLAYDMHIADDGSILWLTKESYKTVVVKLTSSGVLDASFGNGGALTIDLGTNSSSFVSMGIRTDNKLVLGGYIINSAEDTSVVITLNSDGSLYSQVSEIFIDVPMGDARISAIKCVSNNQVLIAGTLVCDTTSFNNTARLGFIGLLNEDGTYDPSFANTGIMTFSLAAQGNFNWTFLEDLEVLSNGDILSTGGRTTQGNSVKKQLLLMSLNSDGTITSSNALEEMSTVSDILVYPNPLNEVSVLSYFSTASTPISIDLFDLSGRHLHSYFSGIPKYGNNHLELKSGVDFSKGNYFLKIKSITGSRTIQIQM